MKRWLLFLLLFIICFPAFPQVRSGSKTYAVVVGIANYENKNIPNLNFSNRDAQVFAEYLQSRAGGSVPAENIRLLIDTNATTAAIYNAMDWLREKCEADKEENPENADLIFFYFSGHGDLEIKTKANRGFLLSFNTPANNYINNAVRLEDINDFAHVMSVDLNANVALITDACHSGNLAGTNNGGTYLARKELDSVIAKEIRIASCTPEQLSQEDERWGGGRGVFSYYLINGLKGLADKNNDNTVTLNEIKKYLDSSIADDDILKETNLKQTPVLNGRDNFKIATVDTAELSSMQMALLTAITEQPNPDYFFSLLKKGDKLELLDYAKLNALPKEEIPFAFIKQVMAIRDTTILVSKVDQLEKQLRQEKEELKLFTENIAEALHTRGQKIINLYLQGDAAELERRRYYNSNSSGYDVYPAMYALALKLVQPGNPLSKILKVNEYYFSGVAARLKLPTVEEPKQKLLLMQALAAQKKALALEENAAYIYNELGILYQVRKEFVVSENSFKQATQLAPEWALPWANLCGLYAQTKNFEKAKAAGRVADSLQADLQTTSSNLGVVNELSGNLLFAEEFYRKAIDINSRHYFPFERLGFVYMNTTQYAQADSFFHEADLRKKGYHFRGNDWAITPEAYDLVAGPSFPCNIDTLIVQKDDILAFFTWGIQNYEKGDYENAKRIFRKVIALDKTNPLVFHYMGKIFYYQKKWEDAEIMFTLAFTYYLDEDNFIKYCDSVKASKKYPYDHECFESKFRFSHYTKIEDYYFLATLYESWNHYDEAQNWYGKIIDLAPDGFGGYVKLEQMLEKLGRYTEAENVISSYNVFNTERTERELNGFYRRIIDKFPANRDWPYRLGLLLYKKAFEESKTQYLDSIIWFPKINKEVFIDTETYNKLSGELSWDISIKGSPAMVDIVDPREVEVFIILPGVLEKVTLADAIYTPRKDAITYLLIADSLSAETEIKADINFKVGNVFVRAGSYKQAYPYYTRSVELTPANANARLSLIDVCKALYKNRAGLEQLDYLYAHQQINFSKQLLLAEFSIHSGQFAKAKKILEEAQAIHPYVVPETFDLMGRLNLLSQQPKLAILFYKNYLNADKKNNSTLYTIAKLYAQTGNKTEAWIWLEAAINNGFNYSYVLKIDPSWAGYRNTPRWNSLINRNVAKKYFDPLSHEFIKLLRN